MRADFKLVFVVSALQVLVYKVLANRVVKGPELLQLPHAPERDSQKRQGFFQKQSLQGAFFDPHTDFKDLEYDQSARALVRYLRGLVLKPGPEAYQNMAVIGSPKFIGYFRKHTPKVMRPYVQSIVKTLLNHHDVAHIKKVLPTLLKEA